MTILNRRSVILLGAGIMTLGFHRAFADEPILTVSGAISAPAERRFTLAQLEALPALRFTTTTPWHEAPVTFEGVDLDAFLTTLGATGSKLRLTALNDYVADMDIASVAGQGAILAYRENGQTMSVTERGPLFLVFPFDDNAALKLPSFYARCVWQLASLEIL
ncbi:hypothetical protein ASG43_13905 [Aureimonas sp. Leaf454]|uniref:hypothetical protein n=1 Tax=Aureimonas sp. Leaf454 TaxID=1736381 RepID=UPI0006F22E5A|nr:hypothetical protein [Aureimonas sp. Leaf454]KQT44437.1 hypothetical protein ASG43_13905 [Aureimonas sp. Leaf454]